MKINNNMTAVIAGNYLMRSEQSLRSSTERLSSGYKLNAAKDNPAGYAISSYMRAQLYALEKANDNANDGIAVIETAEGAVAEIQDMIQRMNELAVQAATGTMSDSDRKAVQEEVNALKEEMERMAKETDFNTMPLLDGTFENKGYTDNVNVKAQYYSDYTKTGKYVFHISPVVDNNGNAVLDANGDYAGYTLVDPVTNTMTAIEAWDDKTGAIIPGKTLTDNPTINYFESKGYALTDGVTIKSYSSDTKLGDFTFNIEEDPSGGYTIAPDDKGLKKLTDEAATITSEVQADGTWDLLITAADGTDLRMNIDPNTFTATPQEVEVKLTGLGVMNDGHHMIVKSTDGTEVHLKINKEAFPAAVATPPIPTIDVVVDFTGIGAMRLQIGGNEGQILALSIPEISLEKAGIADLDCSTKEGAYEGIKQLDYALSYTNSIRAKLGAYQNRLEHIIASLDITEENLTNSYANIVDTDMAEEMTEYTRLQVMQQAGTTMLAQANEYPQKALQLLQ